MAACTVAIPEPSRRAGVSNDCVAISTETLPKLRPRSMRAIATQVRSGAKARITKAAVSMSWLRSTTGLRA